MAVPAAAYDLTTVAAVKQWIGTPASDTNSDDKIQTLITNVSRAILSYCSRDSILPRVVTERRDGYGGQRIVLRQWPVVSVSAMMINAAVIPAGAVPTPTNASTTPGFLLDAWDGFPPGNMAALDLLGGYCLYPGRQNIQITYVAGYMVSAEAGVIPSTPFQITAAQPFGPFAASYAVTIAGVAATKVASGPTAGQYSVSSLGVYTFAAADVGKAVALSYGYTPTDLAQACIEQVGERFKYSGRIGELSKTLGGQETVSYSVKDLPDAVKTNLFNYQTVVYPQ